MNNSRAIVPIGRGGGNGNGLIPPNSNRLMTSSTTANSTTHRHRLPSHHPHPHHRQQHHLQQRPGTSSTSSGRPGTATATSIRIQPPTLLCNLCQKPLATTCFLCACDCIFCEECTYSHFEQSSQCPICQRTLTENDFTELVVADATSATTDIAKTSLQALFSKQSKSNSNNGNQNGNGASSANNVNRGLPYSDLCFSLVRQIDVVKQSTKFLLKQLLMHSNTQSRRVAAILRQNEKLKSDLTLSKQGQSTQRIQYEQMNNDLKNKLNAREMTIQELNAKLAEKEKMLDQFRRLHGGGSSNSSSGNRNGNGHSRSHSNSNSNPYSNNHMSNMTGGTISTQGYNNQHHHQIPPSTGASNRHNRSSVGPNGAADRNRHHLSSAGGSTITSTTGGTGPPLKGLLMQRQAHQINQQENFASRRGPMTQMGTSSQEQHQQQHLTYTRPYSSNNSISSNSISSNTPRVRDLSHGTAFNFTGGSSSSGNSISGGGGGGQRLNKRRRGNNHSATPSSHAMSPNTAFTLNQGAHTVNRGPRWLQKDGRNCSFG